jgi:hypothetical protein
MTVKWILEGDRFAFKFQLYHLPTSLLSGKSLNISTSQFPHLQSENNNASLPRIGIQIK